MNHRDVEQYVMRYFEVTKCQIIEKNTDYILVKLSPIADRELTNRPYYWNFVERTGAEAETMTIRFTLGAQQNESPSAPSASPSTSYQRLPEEKLFFGSARLKQIFHHCRTKGKFVELYEHAVTSDRRANEAVWHASTVLATPYATWLGVNYKVEYVCDMKKDKIYTFGMNLSTGEITENFYHIVTKKSLVPKMPAKMHLRETISLARAAVDLEKYLEKKLINDDHEWASLAMERYEDEVARVQTYYKQLQNDDERSETDDAVDVQFQSKLKEIEQQYRPKITVTVINCGIFHLFDESFRQTNYAVHDTL